MGLLLWKLEWNTSLQLQGGFRPFPQFIVIVFKGQKPTEIYNFELSRRLDSVQTVLYSLHVHKEGLRGVIIDQSPMTCVLMPVIKRGQQQWSALLI